MEKKRFLAVYQRPVIRDWAFWWSIFWAVFTPYANLFPSSGVRTSTGPLIIEVPLMILVGFFVLGWPVAAVRSLIRGLVHRARRPRRAPALESTARESTPAFEQPPPRPDPGSGAWPIYPHRDSPPRNDSLR